MSERNSTQVFLPKLRPPHSGRDPMPRSRLLDRLLEAGARSLVVVAAPAGTGKSTLLAQYYEQLQQGGRTVGWVSLDPHDDGVHRFLRLLLNAVGELLPEVSAAPMALLNSGGAESRDVVVRLIDALLEAGQGLTLILDDYHEITDPEIHASLGTLLQYAPPGLQLVIGSRDVPPLGLSRLRLRGLLLELGWDDLRFSEDETRHYLRQTLHLQVDEQQIAALSSRTEGWAAGLQLAAIRLADGGPALDPGAACSGGQAEVADYLWEDVLVRQSPQLREFLLHSAVLDQLTAALCNRVLQIEDSAAYLEQLDQQNLFIFRLDPARRWFRYHHLFRDFLRERLESAEPGASAELALRASAWHAEQGDLRMAVDYALRAGRPDRAADLLVEQGLGLVYRGEFQELHDWLRRLPEEELVRRPRLALLDGWALAYLGELGQARRRVELAERAEQAEQAAEAVVLRAALSVIQTDEPEAGGVPPDLAEAFPPEARRMRALALVMQAYDSRAHQRLEQGLGEAQAAMELSDDGDSALVNLLARYKYGALLYVLGRMPEAEEVLRGAVEQAQARHWTHSMGFAFLRAQLAMVLHEQGRAREALAEFNAAIELLEATHAYGFLGVAYVERAHCRWSLGETGAARDDLERAGRLAEGKRVLRVRERRRLMSVRMALAAGDAGAAQAQLQEVQVPGEDGELGERDEQKLLLIAGLLLLQGEAEQARQAAERVRDSAQRAGRRGAQIEALLALARASAPAAAVALLQQAVELARPRRIVRPFLRLPERLLDQLAAEEPEAVEWLQQAGEDSAEGAGQRLAESLHPRERQILKLLAEGLRNREIGDRLYLSEETVKWYLKQLYLKLGVRSRTEAVNRARELALIA